MHVAGFDSSDEEVVEEEGEEPLPLSWLPLSPVYSSAFLGVCSLPGCRFKDVRRNLQKDIDGDAPDITTCCTILEELRSCLESNRKTIIHCYGGLGRSCLIAACLLLQLSDVVTPQQAIDSLRDLRGSRAIQTIKQYNFIHDFRENVAAHLATQDTVQRSVSR
ncbi:cyclin-dependent kinase inhibitor 3 isoform X2 [Gallus gallus]|uniref:cyclin-dependent kinase inhibitor 3 isoform X2 n=1 Tax=Gallus gallus TaxID=9031 RepID=UPI001F00F78E|nr:cyclin-dependent kinase inhibitor 3 isoform X2 [Gallus gallus]